MLRTTSPYVCNQQSITCIFIGALFHTVSYCLPRDLQVWSMYKKAEASFWTAEELDLAQDVKVCC